MKVVVIFRELTNETKLSDKRRKMFDNDEIVSCVEWWRVCTKLLGHIIEYLVQRRV